MKIYLSAIFSLLLLGSCASIEEKIELRKKQIEEIELTLKGNKGNSFFYSLDKNNSIVRYYVTNDMVAFINEEMLSGDSSQSITHYYFEDDDLLHVNRKEIIYNNSINKSKRPIQSEAIFDYNGATLISHYNDGITNRELTSDETGQILKHASAILNIAISESKKK